MTGFVVQNTGSFRFALLTGAAIGFVAGGVYGIDVRRRITVEDVTTAS